MARGRDPLPEKKKRKIRKIRFSDEEWERLGELAKQANTNKSDFTRQAVFDKKVVPKVDVEAVRELRRIGVNLNQIAKRMNRANKVVAEEKLRELIRKLVKQRKEIL